MSLGHLWFLCLGGTSLPKLPLTTPWDIEATRSMIKLVTHWWFWLAFCCKTNQNAKKTNKQTNKKGIPCWASDTWLFRLAWISSDYFESAVITPSVTTLLRREDDSKQSDEIQAICLGHIWDFKQTATATDLYYGCRTWKRSKLTQCACLEKTFRHTLKPYPFVKSYNVKTCLVA